MFFAILTLITALSLAGTAGVYSIIGLVSMFGAKMWLYGAIVEIGKVVAISYVYRYWYVTNKWFLSLISGIAIILMLITSMGVYAMLTKGHLDNMGNMSEIQGQISRIEFQINSLRDNANSRQTVINNLDAALERYIELGAISKGLAAREDQAEQRAFLETEINEFNNKINTLAQEKFDLEAEIRAVESEVGPLTYISKLFSSDPDKALDIAIKVVIILLVICLDPLAVLLLIGANIALRNINNPLVQKEFNIEHQTNDDNNNIEHNEAEKENITRSLHSVSQEDVNKVESYLKNKFEEDTKILSERQSTNTTLKNKVEQHVSDNKINDNKKDVEVHEQKKNTIFDKMKNVKNSWM